MTSTHKPVDAAQGPLNQELLGLEPLGEKPLGQKPLDREPLGQTLFKNSVKRDLTRVGVVDIGSNSVRLVVFDGAGRSPAYFYNEKIMCGLGIGMSETNCLNPQGRVRAVSALKRFQALAEGMGITPLSAVATAAVREAKDGPGFCQQVERETGLKIWVIDGKQEARLAAQGVLLGWPGSYGLVCDMGGSSMELAEISDGKVGRRQSSDLGPLKLQSITGGKKARHDHIKTTVLTLKAQMGPQQNRLFLVGGSWRALARIDMERRNYPLHVPHEYRMSIRGIYDTIKLLEASNPEQLRRTCHISANRMALLPIACDVLRRLLKTFTPKDIAISSYGLREGLLFAQMPKKLRKRDPLIEACYFAEAKDARFPGFGKRLYRFILPLFRDFSEAKRRLVKAACLLHDVSWRANPDFRAEICFDNATRSNLGGLKHAERVFLGFALMQRYRRHNDGSQFSEMKTLLTAEELGQAKILGKAIRFGAMLWTSDKEMPGSLRWKPKTRLLELHLSGPTVPLFGEVAQVRFAALSAALNAEPSIKITE